MYIQHRGSQKSTDRANNILFYALGILYGLTTATIIIDILETCWVGTVSINDNRCLTFFQLVLQNVEILYHLNILQATLFALCDVMAQSILVRTTGKAYHYSSNCSKDISLLDCLGLQNSCCDHSIILSICILGSVNLSSFTNRF